MYEPRFYRDWAKSTGLVTYRVVVKESDLCISTTTNLSAKAERLLRHYRAGLEDYLERFPSFGASLVPVAVNADAAVIVRDMARAAQAAGVGPMAAVAGAIAQLVGEKLAEFSPEVIVENGGDIYLRSRSPRKVAVYAGQSPLSRKICISLEAEETPLGICTSSATVGPSLNFGNTDATVAVAPSAALADAAASAIGNVVMSADDIPSGLEIAQRVPGLSGAVIIVGDKLGVWGRIALCGM